MIKLFKVGLGLYESTITQPSQLQIWPRAMSPGAAEERAVWELRRVEKAAVELNDQPWLMLR